MADDIILTATGDAEPLKSEMDRAAESVTSSMERAADAVERLDLDGKGQEAAELGDAFESGGEQASAALQELIDTLAKIDAEEARQAADGVEELADAAERSADAVEGAGERGAAAIGELSERTRAAAAAGVESGTRIARAWEALEESAKGAADGVQLADQAFEALGGSPAEFLAAANSEAERQVILMADLAKNVNQLEEESREGLSGFADRAAKVTQRIDELERSLERQGDQALPGVRQELERLRKQYQETFDTGARRAANLEAEIERQEDALKRMKLEARGTEGGMVDLTEAIRLRFPKASKAIVAGVGSVAAFKEAFQQTREVIDFLEKEFGIKVDSITRRMLALDSVAEGIVGTGNDLEDQFFRLGNSINTLEGAGIEIGDLAERYAELSAKIREATEAAPIFVGPHNKLTDQLRIEGEAAEILAALISRADEAMRKLGETNLETADKLNRSIAALRALQERALELRIEDVSQGFRDLTDAARELIERQDDLRDGPVFEQWVEEATELREQLEELPPALQKAFEEASGTEASEAVSKLDEIADALDVVILNTKEAEEAAKKLAEEQRQAAKGMLDAWGAVADQLRQVANLDPSSPGALDFGEPEIDVEGARRNLEDLERQLAEINAKPILSLDEVNLQTTLLGQIQLARSELSQLEAKVPVRLEPGRVEQDLAAIFRNALASSGFEEAFAALSTETRRAVALLISQLDDLLSTTNQLDPALFESFARAIREALGKEGAGAASLFDTALGRLGGTSSDVVQRLLEVAAQGESTTSSLTNLGAAVQQVETATGDGIIKLSETGEVVAEIGAKAEEASSKASQLGDQVTQAGEAAEASRIQVTGAGDQIKVLGDKAAEAGEAAAGSRIQITGTAEKIAVLKRQAAEASGAVDEMTESLDGAASGTASEGLTQVATAAESAGPAVKSLAEAAQELDSGLSMIAAHNPGDALAQLATRAQETTEPLAQVAEAATAAAAPLGQVADASERIAGAEETPQRLAEIGKVSEEAAPPVTQLSDSAGKLEQSIGSIAETGAEIPEVFEQWLAAAEGLAGILGPLTDDTLARHVEILGQLAEGYRSTTEQQTALNTGATELVTTLDGLRAKTEEVTASFQAGESAAQGFDAALADLATTADSVRTSFEGLGDTIGSVISEETLGRAQQLLATLQAMIDTTDRLATGFDQADAALDGLVN